MTCKWKIWRTHCCRACGWNRKITEIRRDDNAVWYTIQASPQIMKYIVTKGSVTVDGISLTVAKVSETDFSISAIPHTVKITVLGERKEGDIVNLETDIIGNT